MALEDFERELAQSQAEKSRKKRDRSRSKSRDRDKERRRHHHHHSHSHHSSRRDEVHVHDREDSRQSHKRSRREHGERKSGRIVEREQLEQAPGSVNSATKEEEDAWVEKGISAPAEQTSDGTIGGIGKGRPSHRDSWMEAPSALDVDYVQRKKSQPNSQRIAATEADYKLKIHEKELNQHLRDLEHGKEEADVHDRPDLDKPAQHEVKYTFGDAGSSWRMTKLKAVHRQAKESGRSVEDVATERYGDLRAFDDAREEEIEVDRRKMYGRDYVGKEKPSGELYQDRKLDNGIHREQNPSDAESEDEFEAAQDEVMMEKPAARTTVVLDQTALNKLKAQMMKAKLRRDPDAARLESEYNSAIAATTNSKPNDAIVLNKMESRMLTGGRKGEVNAIDNKRGRERGLVEENEDMSIEDMVRQERRTKTQRGGDSRAFAERIAKDAKFDTDHDYLDENAAKLSRTVQKSDVNLRNMAIEDYQKTARMLANCPLCHHEDTNPPTPPPAPLVSLATRVFLTLPTAPEITPYGLCATICPIAHHATLLACDDDEWEEIRNFQKSLTRFYSSQKPPMGVIFYENAAHEGRRRHASLEAIPLPLHLAETAPAFFKEAMLAADEEWTQHRKVIDTLAKAQGGGLGKMAFRKSLVAELPYFHVWFTLDGGFGHVVEDARRWPKGDLFAREILGGMLNVGPDVVKRQGRWKRGDGEMRERVDGFRKGWEKWDWTSVLLDVQ